MNFPGFYKNAIILYVLFYLASRPPLPSPPLRPLESAARRWAPRGGAGSPCRLRPPTALWGSDVASAAGTVGHARRSAWIWNTRCPRRIWEVGCGPPWQVPQGPAPGGCRRGRGVLRLNRWHLPTPVRIPPWSQPAGVRLPRKDPHLRRAGAGGKGDFRGENEVRVTPRFSLRPFPRLMRQAAQPRRCR